MSARDRSVLDRAADRRMLQHAGIPAEGAAPPSAGWGNFERTSSAGVLMARLYGKRYQPRVTYPDPRPTGSGAAPAPRPGFIPGGAAPTQRDPRSRRVQRGKALAVRVPRVGGPRGGRCASAIDVVERRRPAEAIQGELEDNQMRIDAYRPPHVMPVSTAAQKDRLSEINEFRGGRSLPAELTQAPRPGPLPSEAKRRPAAGAPAGGSGAGRPGSSAPGGSRGEGAPGSPPGELLAEQLREEIAERQLHYEELRRLGAARETLRRIEAEVRCRVSELARLRRQQGRR